jgi:hypothetical protein
MEKPDLFSTTGLLGTSQGRAPAGRGSAEFRGASINYQEMLLSKQEILTELSRGNRSGNKK